MASWLRKLTAFFSVFLFLQLTQQHSLAKEVDPRIGRTSSLLGRLQRNLWERRANGPWCASETWSLDQRHARELSRFHLNFLIKVLKIIWQGRLRFQALWSLLGTKLPSIQPLQLHLGWWCWISNWRYQKSHFTRYSRREVFTWGLEESIKGHSQMLS